MYRTLACLICAAAAFAQTPQTPQQDPIRKALQASRDARVQGRFDDAAVRRDEARMLLERMPVGVPQFVGWVQAVAGQYRDSGMTARSRVIVQSALDRSAALGDAHQTRIGLFRLMADSWEQDRNLLKSVSYLEKTAAGLESVTPSPREYDVRQTYQRLADLYQRLGRPDDVAKMVTRIRAIANHQDVSLAEFLDRHGLPEEAAAIYRRLAERAANPEQQAGALQLLANFYAGRQQYGEAARVLQNALASRASAGTAASLDQLVWMRQSLAHMLQQAGRTGDADQVYQQLLASNWDAANPNQFQMLTGYASHLVSTNRAQQAEDLLKQYRTDHPGLKEWQDAGLLYGLASAARASGAGERAEVTPRP